MPAQLARVSQISQPLPEPSTARQKDALTDTTLKALKPRTAAYKVRDGEGMYVVVLPSGYKSFRYDYRHEGKPQTLTIGRYEPGTPSRSEDELKDLDYGQVISLKDARVSTEY